MIRSYRNIIMMLAGLLLCLLTQPVLATENEQSGDFEVTLDFQNVELVDMIGTISELTGKNFVYDESVRGKVSVVSPRPVSVSEAYRLFNTVLKVKGFTIIPSGEVNKIVSVRNAKEENLPVNDGKNLGEQFISRLVELKNLDATLVVDTILRPLMPKTSHVVAYAPTNTIVMTDSAANIKRLSKILTQLDRSWDGERMEIVPLQFSEADESAALVQQILESRSATSARNNKQGDVVGRKAGGQVIPYERTNKLMVLGDDRFIAEASALIRKIDEKADANRAGVHVYYLEHAEAEGLSETLNRIITGTKKNSATSKDAQEKDVFGEVVVTADKPTNALIVNATAKDYENVQGLIDQLDIKRKQVFVEALILELSMKAVLDLGASWQGAIESGGDGVVVGSTNTQTGGFNYLGTSDGSANALTTAVEGIMLGGLFNPITTVINGETVTIPALSALINLSQTNSDVNVLSAPRILTSDNEEAEIIVGENVPIITSKTKDNDGNAVNSVERQDAALTLRFTPQITEGNLVRLKIYQEISDVTDGVGDVNEVGPTFTKRLLRNSIVAQDGKTVVLGGLFQTKVTKSETKVPLLGDIPFLGRLFKRTTDNEDKTSLLIFITPKVIRNSDDLDKITRENRTSLDMFQSEEGTDKIFRQNQLENVLPAADKRD